MVFRTASLWPLMIMSEPEARIRSELHRAAYAVSANSSRPISMRRISLVPAPIS